MRFVKLTFLFGLVATIAWGCSDSLSSNDILSGQGITFQTTRSSYAPGDTVVAVLKNNSSHPIIYGHPFQVREKIDGKWTYIGPSLYFTLIAITLPAGGHTTYRFALSDSLFPGHSLSGGPYRVTTSVGIGDNDYMAKTSPFHITITTQQ